ncbi:hypothetical protein D3C86_1064920 [compost metagenome]
MRQRGKRIEALGVATDHFRDQFAGQVRAGDAVAAVALHVVGVFLDTAELRHARHGQQEVAGPAVVDLHVLQLREGLEDLRADQLFDVVRLARTVNHATAVQQAVVGGQAVVVEQVVAVFDAVVVLDQAAGLLFRQRLGDDDLRTARHALAGHAVVQALRQVGVTGDQQVLGLHHAFGGAHGDRLAVGDFHRRRLLVDLAAQADDRRGFAEGQVQRVNVAALHVQQAADVGIGTDFALDVGRVEHFQVLVAVAFPALLLLGQALELLLVHRREDAAGAVVALDVVVLYALTDDVGAFENHAAEDFGGLVAVALFDDIDVAAVGVDQLAAVATAGAEADFGRFEHGHAVARFGEEQGRGQAGVAGADHADVAVHRLFQHREIAGEVAGGGVVAVYMLLG